MLDLLLSILLSLAPYPGDTETPAERRERMAVIAQAIDTAARGNRTMALLLVVQGHGETRYAQHVHEGRCRPWECDRGKSVSPWQVRLGPWLPRARWEAMRGADLEATTRAAVYTARALRYGLRRCPGRDRLAEAFSVAASGRCGLRRGRVRADRVRALERRWWRPGVRRPPRVEGEAYALSARSDDGT